MSRATTAAIVCFATGVGLAAFVRLTPAQQPNARPIEAIAQERARAAEEVVRFLGAREEAGEALTPTFLSTCAEWNRKLIEARMAAATTPETRIAAVQECLARSQAWLDRLNQIKDGNRAFAARFIRYEIADAEFRLAELKQSK